MIHGHGDDLYSKEGDIKYNFSSNVYYKGCSPKLKQYLVEQMERLENYPSPDARELSEKVANHYHLQADQVLFTNGATEAFYLIAQYFKGKKATVFTPTFAEYEDSCKVHDLEVQLIPRKELFKSKLETDLAFICNPNNPDGGAIELEDLKQLIVSNPNVTFVIDEAYIEFTTAVQSCFNLLSDSKNVIVVRSLTKTYGIPGLRLGYLVSNSQLISEIQKEKMPWSVNALAIASGIYIFNNHSELTFNPEQLFLEKEQFALALSKLENIEVIRSETSYLLLKLKRGTAPELKKYLSSEYQILVRDASNFKGLEGEYIRISTQDTKANQALIKALKTWK